MNRRYRSRVGPAALAVVLGLSAAAMAASPVAAQETTIYLVRHAETAPDGTQDPPLSEAGRARAAQLARMLGGAGLTAIHTTPYRRTSGTAGAVAESIGLRAAEYDPSDLRSFAEQLRGAGGRHLVVGHSNTTPALVQMLGGDPGSPIPETEYGRVYQLTVGPDGVRTAILGYPGGFIGDPQPAATTRPAAAPADVESVDAIIAALYDVISGPAGEARDWDRLRSLFLPTARMIPVQRAPDGRTVYRALAVEEYIQSSGPVLERLGFSEREVAREEDRFGDVAHVFSTYEGRQAGSDDLLVSGINTIQLIHDGARWWISSLAWSPTRPDLPLPARYRGGGR